MSLIVSVVPAQMRRHALARQVARARPRGMQERAAGASRSIHIRFRQLLDVAGVVRAVVRHVVDQTGPPAANPNDPVSFAKRADRDRPDGGVEPRYVAASGENRQRPFCRAHDLPT